MDEFLKYFSGGSWWKLFEGKIIFSSRLNIFFGVIVHPPRVLTYTQVFIFLPNDEHSIIMDKMDGFWGGTLGIIFTKSTIHNTQYIPLNYGIIRIIRTCFFTHNWHSFWSLGIFVCIFNFYAHLIKSNEKYDWISFTTWLWDCAESSQYLIIDKHCVMLV